MKEYRESGGLWKNWVKFFETGILKMLGLPFYGKQYGQLLLIGIIEY